MQSWSEHKVDCEKCEKTGEDVRKKKRESFWLKNQESQKEFFRKNLYLVYKDMWSWRGKKVLRHRISVNKQKCWQVGTTLSPTKGRSSVRSQRRQPMLTLTSHSFVSDVGYFFDESESNQAFEYCPRLSNHGWTHVENKPKSLSKIKEKIQWG